MLNISDLKKLYNGFHIAIPKGNNIFSYDKRKQKKIYVPPLIEGDLEYLSTGSDIAFSEFEDGREKNYRGLKNFLYFHNNGRDIFIFDNHNHAFFFWMAAYTQGVIPAESNLLHIDQHTDMRKPERFFPFSLEEWFTLQDIFEYCQFHLNVGNFIQPLLQLNLFKQVEIIDSSYTFENNYPNYSIVDIDMDIFSDDMAYIDEGLKLKKIRTYLDRASFITIASSPFFIDQQKAIELIHKLCSNL